MREATRHKTRKNARGHHRTSPDIIRHHRVREGRRVPYGPSRGTATRMVVACRMARRRAWSSRAVVSVAGHGVPYGPVRAVSPVAGSRAIRPVAGSHAVTFRPTSATSRLCGGYGRVRRTPVVCHAPAQQSPVADAANRCVRTSILLQGRGVS